MAEGNLLEIVLNKNLESKFESIDKHLQSIEQHTENTVKAIGGLGATLVQEFDLMSKGVDKLSAGVDKLNDALKNMGSTSASGASSAATNISNVAAQLNRLYNEKLRYENELYKLNSQGKAKNIERGGDGSLIEAEYFKAGREYIALLNKVEAKIKELKETNKEAAAEARQLYDAKSMSAHLRNEEQRAKLLARTTEAMRRLNEQQQKNAQKSFNATLGLTEKPQTIEQYRIAIKNLKKEIEQLNPSDRKGIAKLNEQIKQYERELERAGVAQKKFEQNTRSLNLSMQDLAASFGIIFSVQSMINFGKKIVETTGYFEMQHRAMQAIIQDTDKANELWDKTVRLAVKSPYKIKDLVTYTKQLSAYRIETDKLYDTTKMLADISSGLGVDMNRLILAYGQVKAANYLRGQELRQFSEAGVNILGELANYFSELQGRAISTGEVFEMVSKRMVKFEDVATVLHRLTEEGGIFFNMQEQQAETIQGQLMNLRDTFDLFMNSIGERRSGLIVGTIKTIRNTLEDINKVIPTIDAALIALAARFVAIKTAAIATKIAQEGWFSLLGKNLTMSIGQMARYIIHQRLQMANQKAANRLLEQELLLDEQIAKARAAGATAFGGWATVVAAAAVGVAMIVQKIRSAKEEQKQFNEEIQRINTESAATTTKSVAQFKELANKIRDVNTSEAERSRLMQKMKQLYGEILPERLRNIDYIKQEGNAYDEAISSIRNYYLALRREKEIEATINANENAIEEQLDETSTSIQQQIKKVYKLDVALFDIKNALRKLRDEFDAGLVSIDNYGERLQELLQLETGTPINLTGFNKFIQGVAAPVNMIEDAVNPLMKLFDSSNKKLEEATGRTEEFGKKMREALQADVFDQAIKTMNEQLDNDVAAGLMGKSFQEALEYRAKFAEYFFERRFENFKTGDYYKSLSDVQKKAIEDQFKTMLNEQVLKQQVTNAADTIAKSLDDLIDKYNLNEKQAGLMQKFLIGDGESNKEYYDRAKKEIENVLQDIKDYENGVYNLPLVLSPSARNEKEQEIKDTVEMKDAYEALLKILELFWGSQKRHTSGTGGNQALQLLNKQIEAIKNAAKQYEEYKKLYDDTTAFDKTKNAVQDLFGQLGIGNLLDKQGIFDKMTIKDQLSTWLSGQMAKAGKDGRIAIEKYIRELELQASQADFKKVIDEFEKNMDEALSDYDMYKELKKLGIGGDISEQVFGVTTQSMAQLKRTLAMRKKMLLDQYGGTEAIQSIEKVEKKITDLENKETVERLKKYTDYLIKGRDEAVKIHLDQLTKMAELDELYAKGYYTKTQYQSITDKIEKETKQALAKNDWQTFKESDFYTTMFEDLANVADSSMQLMVEKLRQLKNNLSDLDPTQVKEVVQAIEKLEAEGRKRSPIKAWLDDIKKVGAWDSKGNKAKLSFLSPTEDQLKKDKERYVKMVAEAQAEYDKISKNEIQGDEGEAKKKLDMYELGLKLINEQLESIGKEIGIITQNENNGEAAFRRVWEGAAKGAEYFSQTADAAGDVSTEIMGMMTGIDDATKKLAEDLADFAGNAALLIKDIAALIASEGSDVSSWIDAAYRVINLIKSGLSVNEWDINSTIESNINKLEELEWTYDRVQRASERAWDTTSIQQSHRELNGIIQDQINAYDKMIKAEEARKSPDQDQITEWKRSIQEMYETMEDEAEAFYERIGGIGKGNYGDVAQDFVDAWMDAFKETGDGLEGLQDKFAEIIENLVKKQAMQRLAKTLMSGLFEMIDEAAKNGIVTQSELDEINQFAEVNLPQWNEALKNFAQSLGFLGDQAEGELDGLQKGIQGVTEQTAEIIAAYMNAIRYYVIDNNTKLGQLIGIVQDNTGAVNPMLGELRSLRNHAQNIENYLATWNETSGIPAMRVTIV